MAKRYCLEYGLLEKDEANKIVKELAKKKWFVFTKSSGFKILISIWLYMLGLSG